jgi:hypothetical protein
MEQIRRVESAAPVAATAASPPSSTEINIQAAALLGYLYMLDKYYITPPQAGQDNHDLDVEIARVTQELQSLQGQVTDPSIAALVATGIQTQLASNCQGFVNWYEGGGTNGPPNQIMQYIAKANFNFANAQSPDTMFALVMFMQSLAVCPSTELADQGLYDQFLTNDGVYVAQFLAAYQVANPGVDQAAFADVLSLLPRTLPNDPTVALFMQQESNWLQYEKQQPNGGYPSWQDCLATMMRYISYALPVTGSPSGAASIHRPEERPNAQMILNQTEIALKKVKRRSQQLRI